MQVLDRLRIDAEKLRLELSALFLVYQDPRTPWYAKLFTALVVAYALSPIDLIPDFVPVLGYLDDLLIVPLGISLALRMVPSDVIEDCRERAKSAQSEVQHRSWLGISLVVIAWLAVLLVLAVIVRRVIVE